MRTLALVPTANQSTRRLTFSIVVLAAVLRTSVALADPSAQAVSGVEDNGGEVAQFAKMPNGSKP